MTLSIYKNNFCDGQMIYLKEGASSVECRIVTHNANQIETDVYSSLAYHLTKDATKIHCKNRAIISEKSTDPSIVIYYYPQITLRKWQPTPVFLPGKSQGWWSLEGYSPWGHRVPQY